METLDLPMNSLKSHCRCCVPGCKDINSTRFKFPILEELFEIWVSRIGAKEYEAYNPSNCPTHLKICARHFDKRCHSQFRLFSYSVPTKYLPGYTDDGDVSKCFHVPEFAKPVKPPDRNVATKTKTVEASTSLAVEPHSTSSPSIEKSDEPVHHLNHPLPPETPNAAEVEESCRISIRPPFIVAEHKDITSVKLLINLEPFPDDLTPEDCRIYLEKQLRVFTDHFKRPHWETLPCDESEPCQPTATRDVSNMKVYQSKKRNKTIPRSALSALFNSLKTPPVPRKIQKHIDCDLNGLAQTVGGSLDTRPAKPSDIGIDKYSLKLPLSGEYLYDDRDKENTCNSSESSLDTSPSKSDISIECSQKRLLSSGCDKENTCNSSDCSLDTRASKLSDVCIDKSSLKLPLSGDLEGDLEKENTCNPSDSSLDIGLSKQNDISIDKSSPKPPLSGENPHGNSDNKKKKCYSLDCIILNFKFDSLKTTLSKCRAVNKNLKFKIKKLERKILKKTMKKVLFLDLLKECRKYLRPDTYEILSSQLKMGYHQRKKRVRWSDEIKRIVSNIEDESTDAYKIFSRIFYLPSWPLIKAWRVNQKKDQKENYHEEPLEYLEDQGIAMEVEINTSTEPPDPPLRNAKLNHYKGVRISK